MRLSPLALAAALGFTLACAGVVPPTPEAGTYEIAVSDVEQSPGCDGWGIDLRAVEAFEADVTVDADQLAIRSAAPVPETVVLAVELDLACTREGAAVACEQETLSPEDDPFGLKLLAVQTLTGEWTTETTFEAKYTLLYACQDEDAEDGCYIEDSCEITEDWTAELD